MEMVFGFEVGCPVSPGSFSGGGFECRDPEITETGYSTVKAASVVCVPPGVATVIGPVVAPAGTVAHT